MNLSTPNQPAMSIAIVSRDPVTATEIAGLLQRRDELLNQGVLLKSALSRRMDEHQSRFPVGGASFDSPDRPVFEESRSEILRDNETLGQIKRQLLATYINLLGHESVPESAREMMTSELASIGADLTHMDLWPQAVALSPELGKLISINPNAHAQQG
ncbi:hypothetical protein GC207_11285 [bacterium]|nr:hypothetical protein [bacterium]